MLFLTLLMVKPVCHKASSCYRSMLQQNSEYYVDLDQNNRFQVENNRQLSLELIDGE